MLVFGGKDFSGKVCENKLLEFHYDTNSWSNIQTVGLSPSPRWGHCAATHGFVIPVYLYFHNNFLIITKS